MNELVLKITSKALNDIEIITDYIAKDNPRAANKLSKLFQSIFSTLLRHPNLGKTKKNFTYLDARFYIVKKKYLVIYRVIDDEQLRILRVLTTYQDICTKL